MIPSPRNPFVPILILIVPIALALTASLLISDPRQLASLAFLAAVVCFALPHVFPASTSPARAADVAERVSKGVLESRNEVINDMSLLQQELRRIQGAASGADRKSVRDEIARLHVEVAALRQVVQRQSLRK